MHQQQQKVMLIATFKVCSKCRGRKALTSFFKNKAQPCGYSNQCKKCMARYQRTNLPRFAAQNRRSYRKHVTSRTLYQRSKYQIAIYGRTLEPIEMYKNPFRAAQQLGKRSGLEVRLTADLDKLGVHYEYEKFTFHYVVPTETHRITPDLVMPNGQIWEIKGEFTSADRKKVSLFREQHPQIEYRMIFGNAKATIGAKSKTTYALWCDRNGIKWAHRNIPQEWLQEPVNQTSLDAIKAAAL